MECSTFRERHAQFVDGVMSDAELVAMQRHVAECAPCARHDTAVRRSLLVFRNLNLPSIQPSSDFTARLNAKLRQVKCADARAELYRGPGVGAFLAAAASVVAVGFAVAAGLNWTAPAPVVALAPVVATTPARPEPPIVSHTFIATAAVGLPSLWSAALLAEQAPEHFANSAVHLASFTR